MPQYLAAIQHPNNYDRFSGRRSDDSRYRLNKGRDAAGARFFAGGREPAAKAKFLRKQPGGEVIITDGPYLETKEHVGSFWILEAVAMGEALAWDPKPCRLPGSCRGASVPENAARIYNQLALETPQ